MYKIQRWNMLRTKCFNFRLTNRVFGFQFNRRYLISITYKYVGVSIIIESKFLPLVLSRRELFIPSIYTLKEMGKVFFIGMKYLKPIWFMKTKLKHLKR